ncbi:Crp/Fnr family transcriptional regulator [Chelativorans composti]|jgi:cAMP-binding proteins - catabolite gene activator and regulatory subunit of cAMP-dependent protein kinases|uniref:Crp/Fnr family transcriptional regulator n=1 Tax=Chelativorans composti TaxID=768533 RepID=A0ABW5DEP5_9HYPH
MTLDEDMRILSGVELFRGFSREQLRLMAFGAETITLAAGRKLYAEGAPADCAFVVVQGEIALYREVGGTQHIISVERRGAILGQFALIADGERLTGAVARTDAQVIRLGRTMFLKILEEYPELAELLHRRIAADLEAMLDRMSRVMARLIE